MFAILYIFAGPIEKFFKTNLMRNTITELELQYNRVWLNVHKDINLIVHEFAKKTKSVSKCPAM